MTRWICGINVTEICIELRQKLGIGDIITVL